MNISILSAISLILGVAGMFLSFIYIEANKALLDAMFNGAKKYAVSKK